MKEALCKAFCDELAVHEVPAGLAVRTPFLGPDGDSIGFYVVRMRGIPAYRIEDDGTTLPMLEASGVDLDSGIRGEAFSEMAREYGVAIDQETRAFFVEHVTEQALPHAAMKFVAFSLRVRDFLLLTEARVASTFRDDVSKMIREAIGDRAKITENTPIDDSLSEFVADYVLQSPKGSPVGVFLGTSDARVLEALFVKMRATHETHVDASVVVVMERDRNISKRVKQQAMNRLDALTEFRGDEVAAVQRIASEVFQQGGRLN